MALAELSFIDRAEVLHLVGPPGTGKSHLSLALGVEAVKAGRSVYFSTLADLVGRGRVEGCGYCRAGTHKRADASSGRLNCAGRTGVISCTFRSQNVCPAGTRALPAVRPWRSQEDASLVEPEQEVAPLAAAA